MTTSLFNELAIESGTEDRPEVTLWRMVIWTLLEDLSPTYHSAIAYRQGSVSRCKRDAIYILHNDHLDHLCELADLDPRAVKRLGRSVSRGDITLSNEKFRIVNK